MLNGAVDDLDVPAELRQRRIAELVRERTYVRVSELASRFAVSTVTIRSDLQVLEAAGRVHRIHGAAVSSAVAPAERSFETAARELAPEKQRIGARAAELVRSGETVLLDVGTTTTAVARALRARCDLREVTVVTNALNIPFELEAAHPHITVVVTGGTARPLQHSLINPMATGILENLNASICFLGCNGVDARRGITNINLPEAEVKAAMLRAARRRVLVCDGLKFGEVELVRICDTAEMHTVVTDESADPAVVAEVRAAGCEVIVC